MSKRKVDIFAEADKTHRTYHAFAKQFKDADDRWKLTGYPLMKAVEAWAKNDRHDTHIVHCDDNFYATSMLVLIEHKTKSSVHGTTVIFIPQCATGEPCEFFLYPHHKTNLISTLMACCKEPNAVSTA